MRRALGLAAALLVGGALLALSAASTHSSPSSPFHLQKVYTYPLTKLGDATFDDIDAQLDPTGQYLYVEDKAILRILDWRNDKLVKLVDLSDLPCDWYPGQASRDPSFKPIGWWQFIRGLIWFPLAAAQFSFFSTATRSN